MLSAWGKHQIVDINILAFPWPKILWYTQNSQCIKNSIFPSGKHVFPIFRLPFIAKRWLWGRGWSPIEKMKKKLQKTTFFKKMSFLTKFNALSRYNICFR